MGEGCICGVPQENVIEPTLLNIFLIDLFMMTVKLNLSASQMTTSYMMKETLLKMLS